MMPNTTNSNTTESNEVKMNPEVKEKWLSALESGRYKKGQGSLRTGPKGQNLSLGKVTITEKDQFCCLGVLCDLYAKDTDNGEWTNEGVFRIKNDEHDYSSGTLPKAVAKWANLRHSYNSASYVSNYSTNPMVQFARKVVRTVWDSKAGKHLEKQVTITDPMDLASINDMTSQRKDGRVSQRYTFKTIAKLIRESL